MGHSKVGAYFAKTHLAELLDRVAKGESVLITRHGLPAAVMSPPAQTEEISQDEAIEKLRAFRDAHPLGTDLTIKQLVREGRR